MQNNQTELRPIRVGLIALGCAKNMVDAEIMLGTLARDGLEITADPAAADAVIVNTCSFVKDAQEESVDAILESDALRAARNRNQALIVSGCLPQRFRDDLPRLMPEVDAFMGIDQVTRVSEIVREAVARHQQKIGTGDTRRSRRGSQPPSARKVSGEAGLESPVVDVSVRPGTCRTTPRRGSGSRRVISPT